MDNNNISDKILECIYEQIDTGEIKGYSFNVWDKISSYDELYKAIVVDDNDDLAIDLACYSADCSINAFKIGFKIAMEMRLVK